MVYLVNNVYSPLIKNSVKVKKGKDNAGTVLFLLYGLLFFRSITEPLTKLNFISWLLIEHNVCDVCHRFATH